MLNPIPNSTSKGTKTEKSLFSMWNTRGQIEKKKNEESAHPSHSAFKIKIYKENKIDFFFFLFFYCRGGVFTHIFRSLFLFIVCRIAYEWLGFWLQIHNIYHNKRVITHCGVFSSQSSGFILACSTNETPGRGVTPYISLYGDVRQIRVHFSDFLVLMRVYFLTQLSSRVKFCLACGIYLGMFF